MNDNKTKQNQKDFVQKTYNSERSIRDVRPNFSSGDKKDTENAPYANKKNTPLSISGGKITHYNCKYQLGPQAVQAYRAYFSDLADQRDDRGGSSRPRLSTEGYHKHHHPVGADIRALFFNKITYLYEPKSKILDIGASIVRTSHLIDFDGQPLTKRVFSMCPQISSRDFIRKRTHINNMENVFNQCECLGGQLTYRCNNCNGKFQTAMSVDSIYYGGVFEELVHQSLQGATCYAAFNDYNTSLNRKGHIGYACDEESHYEIKNSHVTSFVAGNVAPYHHQFLRTKMARAWQYKYHLNGHLIYVVFEKIDEFENGDIPYILCRIYALSDEDLKLKYHEDNGFEGIDLLPSLFYNDDFSDHFIHKEEKVEVVVPEIQEPVVLTPKEDDMLIKMYKGYKAESGMPVFNFAEHKQRINNMFNLWGSMTQQFRKDFEEFHVTKEDGIHFITCQQYKNVLGIKIKGMLAKAKLLHVLDAFTRLGGRDSASTIQAAINKYQRDFSERGVEIFEAGEAFNIAKIINSQIRLRTDEFLTKSQSARRFYTN
jgi:hypothetical protein